VQSLADLLGLTMPDLPTSATLSKGGLQIVENISSFTVKDEGGSGIWDDDEERRFYEDLPDLRELVPSSLLGIKDKAAKGDDETSASVSRKEQGGDGDAANGETNEDAEQEKQKAVEEDIKRQLEQMSLENQDPKGDKANRHGNGESAVADDQVDDAEPAATAEDAAQITDSGIVGEEEGLQSGPAARLTALFAALPEAVNREMVDKLAVEFAFLNSKAARKRLVKVSTSNLGLMCDPDLSVPRCRAQKQDRSFTALCSLHCDSGPVHA
jgi:regulator of nonsense transcripts 2